MSNWELKQDDEELDLGDAAKKLKEILIRMTAKDFVILLLILMMFLMYVVVVKDIDACNNYYQNLLRNMTQLTTSLW